jgi:hypothetical protein
MIVNETYHGMMLDQLRVSQGIWKLHFEYGGVAGGVASRGTYLPLL